MKPSNWDDMSMEERKAYALELFRSMRGIYIMSEALEIAMGEMKKAERPGVSDIEDMEMFRETFFDLPI